MKIISGSIFPTREAWLRQAADLLSFEVNRNAPDGKKISRTPHVSVGFPSSGGRSDNRIIGQCWMASASTDGNPHIFIHPQLIDPVDVMACMLHELVHALGIRGHRKDFRTIAQACGLEGKMTSTKPSQDLRGRLESMVSQDLGDYPHAALDVSKTTKPKQTTRMQKLECKGCGYVVRATAKWIAVGLPVCPCGCQFQAEGRDELSLASWRDELALASCRTCLLEHDAG